MNDNRSLTLADVAPLPWRQDKRMPTAAICSDQSGTKVLATKEGHAFPQREKIEQIFLVAEINRRVNAFDGMLAAMEAVLAHVEDEGIRRVSNQCTLCFSHRKLLRDAIALAKGP